MLTNNHKAHASARKYSLSLSFTHPPANFSGSLRNGIDSGLDVASEYNRENVSIYDPDITGSVGSEARDRKQRLLDFQVKYSGEIAWV